MAQSSSGSVQRQAVSPLPLLHPEPHVHLAVHRRGGGEVRLGLLPAGAFPKSRTSDVEFSRAAARYGRQTTPSYVERPPVAARKVPLMRSDPVVPTKSSVPPVTVWTSAKSPSP